MKKNIINLVIVSLLIANTSCSQDMPTNIGEYCNYVYNQTDINNCSNSSTFKTEGNYCKISKRFCDTAANYYAKELLQDNRDLYNLVAQSINEDISCPYDVTEDMKYENLDKMNLNKKCLDIQNMLSQYYIPGGNYPYVHVYRLQQIYVQLKR